MVERLKTEKHLKYLILFGAFLMLSFYIESSGDDFVFAKGIQRFGSIGGWMKYFANNWGGRIIPQGFLVLLLQMPDIYFHIVNAMAWVLLLVYTKKIVDYENVFAEGWFYTLFTISLFIFIPGTLLQGALFWKCATVLYLWGTAALLIAFFPLVNRLHSIPNRKIDMALAVFAALYASSFEQSGVLLCGIMMLLVIWCKGMGEHAPTKGDMLLLTITILSTLFFCTLPGNAVRRDVSILAYFQKFGMFTLVDRVLLGINYAISSVNSDVPALLFILAILILLSRFRLGCENKLSRAGSILMVTYFGANFINSIGTNVMNSSGFLSKFFNLIEINTAVFGFSISLLIRNIMAILMITYVGINLLMYVAGKYDIINCALFFAGGGTLVMMGFSPTIYASGTRPRFICYFMLICAGFRCISQFLAEKRKRQ